MEDKGKKIEEYFGDLGYMWSHDLLVHDGGYSSFYDCKFCGAVVHNDNLNTHVEFHENIKMILDKAAEYIRYMTTKDIRKEKIIYSE